MEEESEEEDKKDEKVEKSKKINDKNPEEEIEDSVYEKIDIKKTMRNDKKNIEIIMNLLENQELKAKRDEEKREIIKLKNILEDTANIIDVELNKNNEQIEKMLKHRRKNRKSISEKKENEEFILRYTKARDEYLIKRFKKLYKKDDSYDNSLLSLTKRLCNQQYKNYLNVNNTILLFGETINTSNFIHSSIADFRGLTIANTVPERKKQKMIIKIKSN